MFGTILDLGWKTADNSLTKICIQKTGEKCWLIQGGGLAATAGACGGRREQGGGGRLRGQES